MKKAAFLTVLFMLSGCEALKTNTTQITLPQHIKKVAVQTFANRTNVFGLEEKLRMDAVNEFLRDGRFTVVTDPADSDGYVGGTILNYILQPTAYGSNFEPQQYKLRLIINLSFVDRVNNVTLWDEPNIEEVLFFAAATMPGGRTEEEAKNLILSNMAKKVYIRTIEGFGSVTGTSFKKVPQQEK